MGDIVRQDVECEMLFSIPQVEVYRIEQGTKKLLAKGVLEVLIEEDKPTPFLRVLEQAAPLCKDVPCLRMSRGNYVFPIGDNTFYGVKLPIYAPDASIEEFEKILEEYSNFTFAKPNSSSTPTAPGNELATTQGAHPKLSAGLQTTGSVLEKGSQYVSVALVKGAVILGRSIHSGGEYIKAKLTPRENPVQLSDKTHGRIAGVRKFGAATVRVSTAVVAGVYQVASTVADTIATEIKDTKFGKKLADDNATPTVKAAKAAVKGGVHAISNIHEALWDAGAILITNAGQTTADVIDHKYGNEAGDASRETMLAARDLGVEPLLYRTAQDTASSLTDDKTGQRALSQDSVPGPMM